MGLLVQYYLTPEGFDLSGMYLKINYMRMLQVLDRTSYACTFSILAYKSFADYQGSAQPLSIAPNLSSVEIYLTADQFYDQTIFGFGYDAIKMMWQNAGYVVTDYYPHPPTPTTFIYDCSGYNFRGYNCAGYDREGYDKQGYNKDGYDRDGYNKDGYDKDGYNRQGYDRDGYNREGYDYQGCNRDHKDKDGNPCPTDNSGNFIP